MKIYYVCCIDKKEIQVISELKPKNILISYFYYNKREKIEKLIEKLGYKPNILLDSGAYSSMTQGKEIALTSYIKFVKEVEDLIEDYIQLDVFGKQFITKCYYDIMKEEGLNPMPVFHYGFDESLLQYFISKGEKRIALGGTVPIKSKIKVAEWLKFYTWQYPEIHFHLLGSSSLKILDNCDVHSVDASTWIIMAVMGNPPEIKSRLDKMRFNMLQLMQYEEEEQGMIKKCWDCLKTFGREIEEGKCPFCKSDNVKVHPNSVIKK